MGKIEETLKAEIARLARKELRATVAPLSKNMRDLKRTVSRLARMVDKLKKAAEQETHHRAGKKGQLQASEDIVKAARISATTIKNLRKKLGVSQEKLAALLDVSPAAVAFWEQGRAKPRGKNRAALVALREIGRRDVKRILGEKGVPEGRKRGRKRGKKKEK